MSEQGALGPLLDALRDLSQWFKESHLRGVVIGGAAVAAIGRARITRDVDAMIAVDDEEEAEILASAERHGFVARNPDCLGFARAKYVLLLHHRPSHLDVDVSLGFTPFEHQLQERAQVALVEDVAIPLPRPEDLVVMKAVAGRVQDLRDIEGILDANPGFDEKHILHWTAQFAEALGDPALIARTQQLIEQARKRDPSR